MAVVNVPLGERAYPIVVEPGALARAGDLAAEQVGPPSALVVSNA